jgi:cytochrome c biogenesis protein CcmG/thiol:disulfide interchange protein DsbE
VARTAIAFLGLALLALTIGCGGPRQTTGQSPPSTPSPVAVGALAPDFNFTTFQGESHSVGDLKGAPVILSFWAAYCPACEEFTPKVETVYRQYKEAGLLVFGLSAGEAQEMLQQKAESLGLTYPLALSQDAVRSYGISAIPMTYLIDREGRVQAALLGARELDALEVEVQKIL